MSYVHKIAVGIALVGLSGCGLSKSDCVQGDWFGIGLRDGQLGELSSKIEQHRESCGKHGISPDADLWEQGRQRGLLTYCTPKNAYEVGSRGSHLKGSCSAAAYTEMQPAFERGQKYYDISQRIAHLESEKADIYQELDNLRASNPLGVITGPAHARIQQINLRLGMLRVQLGRYSYF